MSTGADRDVHNLNRRARRLSSRVELLDGLLHEITFKFEEKVEIAQQQVERTGSVCGLATLSYEILAHILSFAIHGLPKSKSLTALRLSQSVVTSGT